MSQNLTTTESRIVNLIATKGMTNAEIGGNLGISEKTVKVHVSNIMRKTGATNRVRVALDFHNIAWRD